jgi:hypothetical protein
MTDQFEQAVIERLDKLIQIFAPTVMEIQLPDAPEGSPELDSIMEQLIAKGYITRIDDEDGTEESDGTEPEATVKEAYWGEAFDKGLIVTKRGDE